MANEYDELDAFTNPEEVKRLVAEGSRGLNRPAFLDVICDIANDEVVKYVKVTDYGEQEMVCLRLTNIRVNRSVEGKVFSDDEYVLEMRWPKRANDNAEPALMVASAVKVDSKVNSIKKLPGLKNVHLVEQSHPWMMSVNKQNELGENVLDDNGRPVRVNQPMTTRYYAVKAIGSKGQSATVTKAKVEVSEEAKAAAITIIESEEDGMSETEFNKAALKVAVLKDLDELVNGKLIADLIDSGKVIRDGEKLRVVA